MWSVRNFLKSGETNFVEMVLIDEKVRFRV